MVAVEESNVEFMYNRIEIVQKWVLESQEVITEAEQPLDEF